MKHIFSSDKKTILKKIIAIGVALIVVIVSIVMINKTPIPKINPRSGVTYEKATVTQVLSEDLETNNTNGIKTGTQKLKVKIDTGSFKDETFEIENNASMIYNVLCKQGTKLVVSISESEGEKIVNIYTYDRSGALFVFVGFFCLVLILIGGKKGVKSLIALVSIFVFIFLIFIPLLYKGVSPIIASIFFAIIATFVTMTLIDGWNAKTISSIISTIIAVSAAGIISTVAGFFLKISDFTLSGTEELVVIERQTHLSFKGILFAAILIASLGAIMDVCMSIASSINELHVNNPKMTRIALFKSGINIGRDMMGTMSNTLILAFTGGFLVTMLVISSYDITIYEILSMPSIVTEIIQGLSGSIGVFLAVPLVSFVSAYLTTLKKH